MILFCFIYVKYINKINQKVLHTENYTMAESKFKRKKLQKINKCEVMFVCFTNNNHDPKVTQIKLKLF